MAGGRRTPQAGMCVQSVLSEQQGCAGISPPEGVRRAETVRLGRDPGARTHTGMVHTYKLVGSMR